MNTEHNTALANALNHTFWVEEFGLVPIFAGNYIRTWQVTMVFVWGTVTFFISYAIVIYLTVKMQKEIKIKTQMTSISSLNLQVQKVLMLQAIGPFVTAVIPMGILSIIVLPDLKQDVILLSCATTFVWISGINASVALFIVRPYRRRILRRLCCFREQVVVRSSVHYIIMK
uniref:G_PROTEIN_RECEP_F1_2 domain-containing protein n=1 Tax=Panagrellus redivivus TaxID=6233 RepID=A0A7E4V049_PANRE